MKRTLGAAWRRLRGGALSPGRLGASVSVGLFVGCLPLYGAQLGLVLLVCVPLRLDAAIAYLAAHVANPLTIPFILALEAEVGSLLLTGGHTVTDLDGLQDLGARAFSLQLGVGALAVATPAAVLGGAAAFIAAHRFGNRGEGGVAGAHRRTLARYADAPRPARVYVHAKLLTDPTVTELLSLAGSFGRTVDVGSGFGQVGLALLENGRVKSLLGLDASPERILTARAAARGQAEFHQADIARAELPEADTFLFVDSLHYLPVAAQDALLERAGKALSPGGRIIIREVDRRPSAGSALTRWLERRASRKRGETTELAFRSLPELRQRLEGLGLKTTVAEPGGFSLLDNRLLVGERA